MSLLGPLRRQAGEDGAALARWIALTRWLISEGAPADITAAAGNKVAHIRRTLRGEPESRCEAAQPIALASSPMTHWMRGVPAGSPASAPPL